MEIYNKADISLFAYLLEKGFYRGYFRAASLFLGSVPFSIEIFSRQIGSVVSKNYTIDIHHRNNIEDIIFY